MKLHEYQSKRLLSSFGIPVPKSKVIQNTDNFPSIFDQLDCPVLIKAQVHQSGRAKFGGIRVARTTKEAENIAVQLLMMRIENITINKILIEELIEFEQGFSLCFRIDLERSAIVLESAAIIPNGKNEEIPASKIHKVRTVNVDPYAGIQLFEIRELALFLGLDKNLWGSFQSVILSMWKIFSHFEAVKVEINPMVVRVGVGLISLGVNVEIDDLALFRHDDIAEFYDASAYDDRTKEARKIGASCLMLEGEIGHLTNGYDMGLAVVDQIELLGGSPGDLIVLKEIDPSSKITKCLHILAKNRQIKVVFIELIGEKFECDRMAEGVQEYLQTAEIVLPIRAHFIGEYSTSAVKNLKSLGVKCFEDSSVAIQNCIEISGLKSK